jgi:hypothetical protein
VVLIPAPIVPELLLLTVRQHFRAATRWLAMAGAGLVGSVVCSTPTARAIAGLLGLAFLVLADRQPVTTRTQWAPALLALLVVVPLGALPIGLSVPTVAIVVAAAAGLAALVALAGPTTAVWTAPVVLVAAPATRWWTVGGRFGTLAFVGAVVIALVAASTFGLPPWPSRLLTHIPTRRSWMVGAVLALVTVGCAIAATAADGSTQRHLGVVTAYALEATVAAAVFAVHLWRFRPRRRVLELTVLLVVGVAGVVVVPELAPIAAVAGVPVVLGAGRVAVTARRARR